MNLRFFLFCIIGLNFVLGCKKGVSDVTNTQSGESNKLFTYLDSTYTGIQFANVITESETFNFLHYEYLLNGGGVALGDINNDGLIDIYFSGNMVYNRLYLNIGDFKFKDITVTAGVEGGLGFKTGVTMSDVNNDGFLDIYICKSALGDPKLRENVLYINNGDLTFSDQSLESGLNDASYSTQAYFFDMDADGDQDVYIVNHPYNLKESNNINVTKGPDGTLVIAKPSSYQFISDRLYQNNNGKFKDISTTAGILNESFGLSAVVFDFNGDNLLDIYVCNDYVKSDNLYINKGNNTFKDEFNDFFAHSSFSSMGSDMGDINNDGCLDLMTLDMTPRDRYSQHMLGMAQNFDKFEKMLAFDLKAQYSSNSLQLSNCNGHFSDIGLLADVAHTDWSWSILLADFDNDGLKDIHISNGYVRDITNNDYVKYTLDSLQKEMNVGRLSLMGWLNAIPSNKIPSFLFKNKGNLNFADMSSQWDSGKAAYSSGTAYADLDNDGYLDIIVSNINEAPFIVKNQGKSKLNNNFIEIELKQNNHHDCTGTVVKAVLSDGTEITDILLPTKGFLSSSQNRIHIGVPKEKSIKTVGIIWPDGSSQMVNEINLNQLQVIQKNESKKLNNKETNSKLFKEERPFSNVITHQENEYIDFKREPLLHHKLSTEGPASSVGDLNGDLLDDLYIGGAVGFAGQIFLQTKTGDFKPFISNDILNDSPYEDVASLIFDANNDGHNDLYVVSGGNERIQNDTLYMDRLYINDGKGNLLRDKLALPKMYLSGSVVMANDVDNDGDLDLFVGTRVVPGRYPEQPNSFFLENQNGKFVDATLKWAPTINPLGLVKDAVFADLDRDSIPELIVCGEWTSIKVFKWKGGQYYDQSENLGLKDITGWWNTIVVNDLNNDGFPEIIAGNFGLNTQIKTSEEKPASILYDDFDSNGTIDPILCYYSGDKNYPLHFRDRLLDQMIFLKKKFLRYNTYASATIEEVFDKKQMEKASKLQASTFAHTIFVNKEGSYFEPKVLPITSQISTVNAIISEDVDNDGHQDLILGGNFYSTDAQIGRYDAGEGLFLKGDGLGNFEPINSKISGLFIPGFVKSIIKLNTIRGRYLWVVRNNEVSTFIKISDTSNLSRKPI